MIQVDAFGDVTRFRLGRNIFGRVVYVTAAYLVDGLMIDTGCAHCVPELMAALDGLDVRWLVNTHAHEDHIGANAAMARRFGIEPRIHPVGLPILADPGRRLKLKLYQKIVWGRPEPSVGVALGDRLEAGDRVYRVVHTPGHSADHVCLYDADRGRLFTGDAFVGGRDRALRSDYDIWAIIRSLKKLLELEPEVMYTASGSIREKAVRDLATKIDYLENLGGRILDLSKKGLNYKQIRSTILGTEHWVRLISQGHFSGINLVRSFIEDRPSKQGGRDDG